MDDLMSSIQGILNSEEGMKQLQDMASMLGLHTDQPTESTAKGSTSFSSVPMALPASPIENKGGFPDFDMNTLIQIQKILGSLKTDDKNTRLLLALKPHFTEKRQKKVDDALKIMQLLSVLPLIKQSGLFGSLLGGGH